MSDSQMFSCLPFINNNSNIQFCGTKNIFTYDLKNVLTNGIFSFLFRYATLVILLQLFSFVDLTIPMNGNTFHSAMEQEDLQPHDNANELGMLPLTEPYSDPRTLTDVAVTGTYI